MAKAKSAKPSEKKSKGLLSLESLFSMLRSPFKEESPLTKEEQAQDLFYKAMQASTPARTFQMLESVLKLDPNHVDALLVISSVSGEKGEKRIQTLRSIVAAGKQKFSPEEFQDMIPHFWGILETRPYMRARHQLAMELATQGNMAEAISECQEMLLLNDGDNQGVRYELLPLLLQLGRLEESQTLLEKYKDDWSVVFLWGRVLQQFLSGKQAAARKALAQAREQNAHVEPILIGQKKVPKKLPDVYSPGTLDEAVCYAASVQKAWKAHPEALTWLIGESSTPPPSKPKGKKKPQGDDSGWLLNTSTTC